MFVFKMPVELLECGVDIVKRMQNRLEYGEIMDNVSLCPMFRGLDPLCVSHV